ncbi:MAG: pilus assembly protein [Lachnospiraceae bacterium]|nr:pilus assembly protein [Lachnospiraceae bacterium]
MKLQKGSYTIEGTILVPMLLFVIFTTVQMGISFYQEGIKTEISDKIQNFDIVEEFYAYQLLKEVVGELEND